MRVKRFTGALAAAIGLVGWLIGLVASALGLA